MNLSVLAKRLGQHRRCDEASCRTHRQRGRCISASGRSAAGVAGAQDAQAPGGDVQVERRPGARRGGRPRPEGPVRPGPDRARLRGPRRRRRRRPITDFRHDLAGVSVALLFDVSGSMEGQLPNAREAATHVLSWLDATRDEAAVFTFDTRLDEVTPFTTGLKTLPESLSTVDAVRRDVAARRDRADGRARRRARGPPARGRRVDRRQRQREPADARARCRRSRARSTCRSTSSASCRRSTTRRRRSATQFGRAVGARRPACRSRRRGPAATSFVASTPAQRSVAARQIVDELRHQYLIAFESSGKPGWHPLVVRARNKDLTVRARSGYIAGQSRPISH